MSLAPEINYAALKKEDQPTLAQLWLCVQALQTEVAALREQNAKLFRWLQRFEDEPKPVTKIVGNWHLNE